MKFGLIPAAGRGISASAAYIAEYVETAEALGFDSVWMGEHPALPADSDTPYPGGGTGRSAPTTCAAGAVST